MQVCCSKSEKISNVVNPDVVNQDIFRLGATDLQLIYIPVHVCIGTRMESLKITNMIMIRVYQFCISICFPWYGVQFHFHNMLLYAGEPSKDHEVARRRVENTATEFWYYVRHQLLNLKNEASGSTQLVGHIDKMLGNCQGYQK